MTQLRGGCLKAVTFTHSSILPNHPPTVPHSRREQETDRGRGSSQERKSNELEEEEEENAERENKSLRQADKHLRDRQIVRDDDLEIRGGNVAEMKDHLSPHTSGQDGNLSLCGAGTQDETQRSSTS